MIRQTRKAAQLSQSELAALSGLSRAIISQLENGKSTVRLDVIEKILRTLNMELWLKAPHQSDSQRIF
ncbi:MAG: helix-turn-helix domain-containing protein [Puniceicoccaceae bacterium]